MIGARLNVFDGIPYRKPAQGDVGEPCPHHENASGVSPARSPIWVSLK